MNPLTDEELIKDCEMALSYFDMSDEVSKRFCELLNRFRKLTQPEQVSGDLTDRIVEAVRNIAATETGFSNRTILDGINLDELRKAIKETLK